MEASFGLKAITVSRGNRACLPKGDAGHPLKNDQMRSFLFPKIRLKIKSRFFQSAPRKRRKGCHKRLPEKKAVKTLKSPSLGSPAYSRATSEKAENARLRPVVGNSRLRASFRLREAASPIRRFRITRRASVLPRPIVVLSNRRGSLVTSRKASRCRSRLSLVDRLVPGRNTMRYRN